MGENVRTKDRCDTRRSLNGKEREIAGTKKVGLILVKESLSEAPFITNDYRGP